MTHRQRSIIDQLAREHGRTCVNELWDGSVEVAIPSGACWLIKANSNMIQRNVRTDINWGYE